MLISQHVLVGRAASGPRWARGPVEAGDMEPAIQGLQRASGHHESDVSCGHGAGHPNSRSWPGELFRGIIP